MTDLDNADKRVIQSRKITPLTALKLSSLMERDETPEIGTKSSLDTIISSPIANSGEEPMSNTTSPALKTPRTARRLYPCLEEMHPSKAQHSTVKQPDSGLKLGFTDVGARIETHETPTKIKAPQIKPPSTASFEFKFTRPESEELSSEAQKMMESIREEAGRIKVQLAANRDEEKRKVGESDSLVGIGGRKIARAKGKVGRYSDVHLEEFKKMDSIAGHASAFRAQAGRFPLATTSLKRTNSQANLDESEGGMSCSRSIKSLRNEDSGGRPATLKSGKRMKQQLDVDSSPRFPPSHNSGTESESKPSTYLKPFSRKNAVEVDKKQSTVAFPRSKSGLPTVVTTPTKASLARSASVKHPKTSMIPSLSHSPSTKSLASPVIAKTEGSKKYLSSLAKLGSMRSILRRPQPLFSDDPIKQAAGTHLATPKGKSDLNKDLPSLPGIPSSLQRSPTLKHVNFTPNTLAKCTIDGASPSPSRIPALHRSGSEKQFIPVAYPALPKIAAPSPSSVKVGTDGPGIFTFRSDKILNFGPAPAGSTIRQVHPNDSSTSLEDLPTVPHGKPNKKRRREDSENASDVENCQESEEEGPRTKKMKGGAQWEPRKPKNDINFDSSKKGSSRIPRAGVRPGTEKGKRGILSISRLNMLARPKVRRGED
ncbi:MAG: hypothetical protein M1827_004838 [Pycnora praestabilis]|nr:MAG: hypothetical protein M1827_004838 [Pycnora praestabilis]